MIIKSQVSVSSLLLNIPKAACTESNGLRNKKQSKDLCGGESTGTDIPLLSFWNIQTWNQGFGALTYLK